MRPQHGRSTCVAPTVRDLKLGWCCAVWAGLVGMSRDLLVRDQGTVSWPLTRVTLDSWGKISAS